MNKVYKILSINADILPKEYWKIDIQAITQALKDNVKVTGVTFEVISKN